MSDAVISFTRPVYASLRVDSGWALVEVRSVATLADGRLTVTLAVPYEGRRKWTCTHASLRSVNADLTRVINGARGNAVGAGISRILRQIADGVDAARGEPR